jgi:hypothetical protein
VKNWPEVQEVKEVNDIKEVKEGAGTALNFI